MRLFNFLVQRQCDRATLQHERDREHNIGPLQIRRRMWMREFFDAFVDRVSRTDAENKNRSYERPEKPLLAVPERVLVGGRSLVKPQTQQQKDLVCRIGNRVERLSHHAGGACNHRGHQLQYRDQSVSKERAKYGKHMPTDYTEHADSVKQSV